MSDEVKKLYRSDNDRWIAGVCGGLAEYFNIDPTIVRLIFLLFGLFVGGGLLAYIILWIVMPVHPAGSAPMEKEFEPEPAAEESSEESSE